MFSLYDEWLIFNKCSYAHFQLDLEKDEWVWDALVDIAWVVGVQDHEWFAGTGPRVPELEPLWPQNQRDPDMLMANPMENEWWPGDKPGLVPPF